MARCEDYPCCGHGPAPYGDGGGCPDEQGRFRCVECGKRMPRGAPSAICAKCRNARSRRDPEEQEWLDEQQAFYDEQWR